MICADCGLGIKDIKDMKFYWYHEGEDSSAIITICEKCYNEYVNKDDLYDFVANRIMSLTGDRIEIESHEVYIC